MACQSIGARLHCKAGVLNPAGAVVTVWGQKAENNLYNESDMTENTAKFKELHLKVARVLLSEWDPIGIRDVPKASDEYESICKSCD